MPKENIISTTNTKHVAYVRMQLSELTENPIILGEPVAKNTAPAIVLATKYIMQKSASDPIILAVPSDLLIKDNEKFVSTIKKGEKLGEISDYFGNIIDTYYAEFDSTVLYNTVAYSVPKGSSLVAYGRV